MNVCDFVMSYNFDDSNAMTDYFHTNFYLTLGIGSYRKPYKVELPKLACKGKEKQEVFKHPEGTAHRPCGRHWVRHGSVSSNTGGISAR